MSSETEKHADKIAQEIAKLLLDLSPDSKPKVNANRLKCTLADIWEFADNFRVTTTLKFSDDQIGSITYTRDLVTDHDVYDLSRPREVAKTIAETISNTFTIQEVESLQQNLVIVSAPKPKEAPESKIQDSIKEFAPKVGATLFRNTVGIFKTAWGGTVHTGLCKGSSDLVGWTTKTVTPDMVGQQIAIFTAIECKKVSKGAATTDGQKDFIAKVLRAGGYAGVATRLEDLLEITENKTKVKL